MIDKSLLTSLQEDLQSLGLSGDLEEELTGVDDLSEARRIKKVTRSAKGGRKGKRVRTKRTSSKQRRRSKKAKKKPGYKRSVKKRTRKMKTSRGKRIQARKRNLGIKKGTRKESMSYSHISKLVEQVQELVGRIDNEFVNEDVERLERILTNAVRISEAIKGRFEDDREIVTFFSSLAEDAAELLKQMSEGDIDFSDGEGLAEAIVADLVSGLDEVADDLDEMLAEAAKSKKGRKVAEDDDEDEEDDEEYDDEEEDEEEDDED